MKLPTSNKTSFGKKPHIKKGYYPGQLLKVEPYTDSDGNLREGKYGRQLIFEFAIYKGDSESGEPLEPMTFKADEDSNVSETVIIPKFVYHQYKNKKVEGEFQTAITPKSAITRLLTALGWTFSTEAVDPDDYIGNWVEINVDEYEFGEGDEKYTASTIKDISEYKGPKPSKDLMSVKPKEKKDVKKQVKHEAVEKDTKDTKATSSNPDVAKIKAKIGELEKLKKEGFLTEDGLKQAVEQLETKIEELEKK